MTRFPAESLGALVDKCGGTIRTGPFGSQLHRSDYSDEPEDPALVMPKDMSGGRVRFEGIARVVPQKVDELRQHLLREGDVVLARRGDIGRCAWIGTEEEGSLCGTGSMRISLGDGPLLPRFLFYALMSRASAEWLQSQAVGTTMSNLSTTIVRGLPVPCPERDTQARIVDVLDAFDELLHNNTRRIDILEEAARSLFHEWFVRYRYPGAKSNELEQSSVGPIPTGWRVAPLSECVDVNPAKVDPATWDEIRYLDISALSERSLDWPAPIPGSEAPGRARRHVQHGDVVHATVRPNRRAHALVLDPPPNAVASTGLVVLRPRTLPSTFVYELISRQSFTDYLVGRATGAAYPAVKPRDFEEALVVRPDEPLVKQFAESVDDAHALVSALRSQNDVVASARDGLLPRLITGDVASPSLLDEVIGWPERASDGMATSG